MKSLVEFLQDHDVNGDKNVRMHDFKMQEDDNHVMLIDTATIKNKDGLVKTINNRDDSVSNNQLASEQIESLENMIAKYKAEGRDDLVKIEVAKLANLRESLEQNGEE